MINKQIPRYLGNELPKNSKLPTGKLSKHCYNLIHRTYEEKLFSKLNGNKCTIMFPKKNNKYQYRIIRGSISSTFGFDFYDDREKFEEFYRKIDKDKFMYWSSFGLKDIELIFCNSINVENQEWMANARMRENQGIISLDGEISVVSSLSFEISVFFLKDKELLLFDKIWSYEDGYRSDLEIFIEKYPFGELSKEWLRNNILPLV
ncbi:MAG: hypothetical protein R3C10_28345 [Pirellulales bacterium]